MPPSRLFIAEAIYDVDIAVGEHGSFLRVRSDWRQLELAPPPVELANQLLMF